MKINVKSPLFWVAVVALICCIGYLKGGHIVAGIVCIPVCGAFFFLSMLIKPKTSADKTKAPVNREQKERGNGKQSVQSPSVAEKTVASPDFIGTSGNVGNDNWDLSIKYITKNGKDWFDVSESHSSASGFYALCDGYDNSGNSAIALVSKVQGLKIRRVDADTVDVYVSDDGTGYALLDDNTLLVINASSANIKKLSDESADRSAHLLCSQCCAIAGNDGDDKVHIDAYDCVSQKMWHKNFSAEYTGDDIILTLSDDIITVSYNGITKRYRINGESI